MAAIPNELRNQQNPPDGWVSRVDAAKLAGVSTKQIERWHHDGAVRAAEHGGKWWYDPEALPAQNAVREGESIRALTSALREAHDHAQRCNDTMIRSYETLSLENERRASYAAKLEETIRAQNELVDRMLTQAEERQQAREKHDAAMKRSAQAFDALMTYAPSLASALAFKWAPDSRAVQETQLTGLVERLPIEALSQLKEAGFVSAEQFTQIADMQKKLREQRQAAELKAASKAEPAAA